MSQSGPEPQLEVSRKGNPVGIHPLGAISGLIASGQLEWTDDCWTEGMESWAKLSDLKDRIDAAGPGAQAQAGSSNTPLFIGIGVSVLIVAGAAAYFVLAGDDEPNTGSAGQTTATPQPAAGNTPGSAASRKALSDVQQQISGLIASSFVEKRSDDQVSVVYSHRYYENIGNRIPLRVLVDASGQSHLVTFYAGRTWIFHDQLRFEFDNQALETSVIPAHKAYREVDEKNTVTEVCHFLSDDDKMLVGKLAQAGATPLKMRMLGRRPTQITLSFETKQAIREAHLLSELLAKRSKLVGELPVIP